MLVYVVASKYQNVDSGDSELLIERVFNDFSKAQEYMEERIEEERQNMNHLDYEEDNYVEGDMSWGIWEKGEYMSCHFEIVIREMLIE